MRNFYYLVLMIMSIFFVSNVNAQKVKSFSSEALRSAYGTSSETQTKQSDTNYKKVSSTICYNWNGSIKSAANVDVYLTQDGILKVKCNDQYYDMKPNYSYDSNSTNSDQSIYYRYYILMGSNKFYLNY